MSIQWQTAPYCKAKDAQIADTSAGRLFVRRSAKGRRTFDGFLNGKRLGCWDTIDMAKSQVSVLVRAEELFTSE